MLSTEQIAAMAAAAIAEETHTDPKAVRILSFKEIQKSSLKQYIEDHQLSYQKFTLGDFTHE